MMRTISLFGCNFARKIIIIFWLEVILRCLYSTLFTIRPLTIGRHNKCKHENTPTEFCRFDIFFCMLIIILFFVSFYLNGTNLYCADYALKLIRTPYDLFDSVLVLYWEQMSTQSPKTTLTPLPLIRAFSYFQLKFWCFLSVAGKIKPFRFIFWWFILFIYLFLL